MLSTETSIRFIFLVKNIDNSYRIKKDKENNNKAIEFKTYFLPWNSGEAYMLELANDANYFLTPQLDGCCVMINGTRQNPTVIHANYNLDDLQKEMEDMSLEEFKKQYYTQRLYQYASFYTKLAAQLLNKNIFDSEAITSIFDPEFYLNQANSARIFGIRKNDEWTFYYNIKSNNGFITKELWPNFSR
ncbi:MAG: hypothetical protein AAF630_14750 [Cyanobacteria bacterium P01_C01_bin.38]